MKGSFKGAPVMCLIPGADKAHLHSLSGDPQITSIVTEATPIDVGKLCAVYMLGLDPAQRREALRHAAALASGPKIAVIPVSALMPEDASVDQLAQVVNGLNLLLLALGSSSADTSVGTVVANAASMASGVPFASDPLSAERQNEVVLAKAILEAHLLGDEAAAQWFKDNDLIDALQKISEAARQGASDSIADPAVREEVLKQVFDCYQHQNPLGGNAALSGDLGDFLGDIWKSVKDTAGKSIENWGKSIASPQDGVNTASSPSGSAGTTTAGEASSLDEATSGVSDAIAQGVAQARQALEDAKQRMENGQANIATYQSRLKQAALENAKLQWAQAFLDAPDDVATILSAATPNLSDPGSFIQSMLATLPAAKTTGNLGTIKALLYALKAAAAKGDGSADMLYSLVSGDIAKACEQLSDCDDMKADVGGAEAKIVAQKAALQAFARSSVSRVTPNLRRRKVKGGV